MLAKTALFSLAILAATTHQAAAQEEWATLLDVGLAPIVDGRRGEWVGIEQASGVGLTLKTVKVERGQSVDTLIAAENVRPDGDSRGLVALLNPNLSDLQSVAEGTGLTLIHVEIRPDNPAPFVSGTLLTLTASLADRRAVAESIEELNNLLADPRASQIRRELLPQSVSPQGLRAVSQQTVGRAYAYMRQTAVLSPAWSAETNRQLVAYNQDFRAVLSGERPASGNFGTTGPLSTLSNTSTGALSYGIGHIKVETSVQSGAALSAPVLCELFWALAGVKKTAQSNAYRRSPLRSSAIPVALQTIDVWAQYDGRDISDVSRIQKAQLRENDPQPVVLYTAHPCGASN